MSAQEIGDCGSSIHASVPGSTENKQDGHCQQKSRCHRNQDIIFSWSYICISSIVSDSNFGVLRCVTMNSIIQICVKEIVIWVLSTFIFFELGTFSPKSEMYVYPYPRMHDYIKKVFLISCMVSLFFKGKIVMDELI